MKKKFFRLYYRRNVSKSISCNCTGPGTDATVTSVAGGFQTVGDANEIFVGATVTIDSVVYRVASITDDNNFELDRVFESATASYVCVFTTPVLSNTTGSDLIDEVDDYWTEFKDAEIGAKLAVEKGDSQQKSTGENVTIEEKGMIEFNVLGFGESSSSPNVEGRYDELRTALNQKKVDILLFNYETARPEAIAYYDIFGNCQVGIEAGALPKILITSDEAKALFTDANVKIFAPIIDTPVLTPDSGAHGDIVVTCGTLNVKMYITANGDTPDEEDTEVYNNEVYTVVASSTVKVKAFKHGMTASAVGSGTYS